VDVIRRKSSLLGCGDPVLSPAADLEVFFHSVPSGSLLARALPDGVAVTFEIRGQGGGTWTVSREGDGGEVRPGKVPRPDCRLSCSADDFRALLHGSLDPRGAFLDGRLEVQGDVGLVLRLHRIVARVSGP
jgi:hypothetical protein